MVLAVGFLGSPRKGGNTDLLLSAALRGAGEEGAETVKVVLNELDIRGCQECGRCMETGRCAIKDDMQALYDLLERLDIILMASPIFFSGLSSQTKMFIDRCQCIWVRKFRLNRGMGGGRRLGAFLSVGGRGKSNFRNAISVIKTFFFNIDVEYAAELTYPGIDAQGSIRDHPTALEEAASLGRDLVRRLG